MNASNVLQFPKNSNTNLPRQTKRITESQTVEQVMDDLAIRLVAAGPGSAKWGPRFLEYRIAAHSPAPVPE